MHEVCQIRIVSVFLVLKRMKKTGLEKIGHELAKMTKMDELLLD